MPTRGLDRLRKLCLALPEVREVESWGTATFRVKTILAMYAAPTSHHADGREGVWIKATKVNQALMIQMAPNRFFFPPYVGPSGWVGVYLDSPQTDWDELAELLRDAWRMSAPKKLVVKHESSSATDDPAPKTAATAKKSPSKRAGKKSAATKRASARPTAAKGASTKKSKTKRATSKRTTKRTTKRAAKRTTTRSR